MKKILTLFIVLLPIISSAQVRVASAAKPANEEKKFLYDSIDNCPLIYAEQCRGQELFLMPQKDFFGFQKKDKSGSFKTADMKDNVGHVFDVIDVINGKEYIGAKLILRDKETQEEFRYSFPTSEAGWPFLTLGYKAKYENKHKGEQFVAGLMSSKNDFNTGEPLGSLSGTVWTFDEMISTEDGKINFLYSDENGRALALDKFWQKHMHKKAVIDSYISKYGSDMVNAALKGSVVIEMPSDLVKIAKGSPDKINSASYGQQWVYKNKFIYIKDGKVTGWN